MQRLAQHPDASVPDATIDARFARIRAGAAKDPFPGWEARRRRLEALLALIHDGQDALAEAMSADFGHRARAESRLLEIFPSLEAVRHALRHGQSWMRTERRPTSLWFLPGSSKVVHQPLGVVGIIAPWNYPLYLAVGPLVAALAAGNRAMLKLSELTPRTSALFAQLVADRFADDEVTVVEGDAKVAAAFARLPFDHLLFTGSTGVGREVMRAAAENLTPVTLELGGKSPAIVTEDADFKHAAERIVFGKSLNAGQTCIAPDYALVPAMHVDRFVEAAKSAASRFYPDIAMTPDYSSIVNPRHFKRLTYYLDDAIALGAEIVPLTSVAADATRRRMPPLILLQVTDAMQVANEEIFGPILPVIPYGSLDDAIRYVETRPRPLALYLFARGRSDIDRVLRETHAGGVTVNDVILHIAQDSLPFGGIGASGMGHYHGREGFLTFSKSKGVFTQSRLSGIGLFNPPFGPRFERLVRFLIR
jgi:aldehyde dehydrogenase (NAD+)/coniferyl-aldehyde dehydrogenase